MTVEEIKALLPEAAVYECDPNARYIIVCDKDRVSPLVAQESSMAMKRFGIKALILRVQDIETSIKILQVGE